MRSPNAQQPSAPIVDQLVLDNALDPEFHAGLGYVTWQLTGLADNPLYLATVNLATGLFEAIQQRDSHITRLARSGQGPEWARHNNKEVILYTRDDANGIPQIVMDRLNGTAPVALTSGGQGRTLLSGSKGSRSLVKVYLLSGPAFPGVPTILDTATGSETPAPPARIAVSPPQWLSGNHVLFASAAPATTGKIASYNAATAITTILAESANGNNGPQSWEAPEFDGLRVYVAISDDLRTLNCYKTVPGSSAVLTPYAQIQAPAAAGVHHYLGSVEAFVMAGKSRLSLTLHDSAIDPTQGSVWVWDLPVDANPGAQVLVSDSPLTPEPYDPEYVVVDDTLAFIYYNRYYYEHETIRVELRRGEFRP